MCDKLFTYITRTSISLNSHPWTSSCQHLFKGRNLRPEFRLQMSLPEAKWAVHIVTGKPLTPAWPPLGPASMVLEVRYQTLQPAANQVVGECWVGRMHGKEKRWRTAQQWGSGSRSRKTGLMTKKAELVGPISIEEEHPPFMSSTLRAGLRHGLGRERMFNRMVLTHQE